MKKLNTLAGFLVICSVAISAQAEWLCPNCQAYVKKSFCTRCGMAKPLSTIVGTSQRDSAYSSSPRFWSNVGDRLAGVGRGVVTATLAPLNFVRGMMTGGAWAFEAAGCPRSADGTYSVNRSRPGQEFAVQTYIWFTIPVGAAAGSFSACADLVNGTLDTVTLGCYGDWLYESDNEGKPTPWIWERKWRTSRIPWIDR